MLRPEECQSGRMGLTRNQVSRKRFRGFESLLLRQRRPSRSERPSELDSNRRFVPEERSDDDPRSVNSSSSAILRRAGRSVERCPPESAEGGVGAPPPDAVRTGFDEIVRGSISPASPGASARRSANRLRWGRAPESAEGGSLSGSLVWSFQRLQWGRAPESAEGWRPRRGRCLRWIRFNGAALRRARKGGRLRLAHRRIPASMGPRSGERGRTDLIALAEYGPKASMGPRSGERGRAPLRVVLHPDTLAASMGPRSGERGRLEHLSELSDCSPLQWGRAPESAEGDLAEFGSEFHDSASMGPRSGERGRSRFGGRREGSCSASMGPRSGERGRQHRGSRPSDRAKGFNGAALRRARKGEVVVGLWTRRVASMGPRSGERGRAPVEFALLCVTARLQWGRAPESAEGRGSPRWFLGGTRLQWGRAPESAEGPATSTWTRSAGSRFNGAALRRARKATSSSSGTMRRRLLQWGRAPESAEGSLRAGSA